MHSAHAEESVHMNSIKWRTITIVALVMASVFALVPRSVKQRIYDSRTGQMRDTTIRRVPIDLGLDLRGGVHLALEVDQSRGAVADCADAIRRAERVVRTRINEFGTTEPVVQATNNCRLIVELPGETDPARAKSIVERTAFLEFRITDTREQFRLALPAIDASLRRAGVTGGDAATDTQPNVVSGLLGRDSTSKATDPIASGSTGVLSSLLTPGRVPGEFYVADEKGSEVERLIARPEVLQHMPRGIELRWGTVIAPQGAPAFRPLYAVQSRAIITGEELQRAVAGRDPMTNAAEVQFELTRVGGRLFGDATGRNIGNYLAILLDGRVQGEPPVIRDRISTNGRIELGGKSLEEANDLALVLRAGALPAPLHVVNERTIGPSLGSDSVREGVRASAFAVGFVLLTMTVYYGLSGLLAVAALGLYVLFCLGGLAVFGFTLTLPGLAGFALSIGMAVDANVLIFERMREEMDAGKPVKRAIDEGFRHAMSAIIDSNVTTALTALILYLVGTESVQGFAITLLIGLVASMITAVFVTRTFFLVWVKRRPNMTTLKHFNFRLFKDAKYDFIKVRRWAYGVTAAMIVPGIIMLATMGITYSIEFTGGAMMHVTTKNPVETTRLRTALERGGVNNPEIQSFGSDRDYVVRARLASTSASDAEAASIKIAADKALAADLGAGNYKIERSEGVGPKVGQELQQKAIIAILFSFVTTLIYLAFRFEWRFGLAAVIATAHDVVATVAFVRYLDLEVSLVVVAAVLTVLGYSLNDTIVIFDRVRENLRLRGRRTLTEVLNLSINETLPRTVLTGGTTLATALVLSFFAGEVIKPFALVMTFGIVVGTFSSIFVASPVLLWITQRWGHAKEQGTGKGEQGAPQATARTAATAATVT
jgi:protein-export membrane protein SecD/preprotein translocase SecF subunit